MTAARSTSDVHPIVAAGDDITKEIEEAGRRALESIMPCFDRQQAATAAATREARLTRHEARRLKGSSGRALAAVGGAKR